MAARGYRFLFATYPFAWRVRFEQEMLAVLRDADALHGRRAATLADRVGFLLGGIAHRRHPSAEPAYPRRRDIGEHRFDQSNGLIAEREQTAFENEHSRWWDRLDVPGFVPVGFTGGRPQERT